MPDTPPDSRPGSPSEGEPPRQPEHQVPWQRRPGRWDVPEPAPWHRPRPRDVLWNVAGTVPVAFLAVVVVGEWDALVLMSVILVGNAVVSAAQDRPDGEPGAAAATSTRAASRWRWVRWVVFGWPVLVGVVTVALVAVWPASADVRYPAGTVSAVTGLLWVLVLVLRRRR